MEVGLVYHISIWIFSVENFSKLLLEQILDASNVGRLIGHVFHHPECVYSLADRTEESTWVGKGMVWMRLRGRNVDQDSCKDKESLPLHVLNKPPSCIFLISSQREVSFHTGGRRAFRRTQGCPTSL